MNVLGYDVAYIIDKDGEIAIKSVKINGKAISVFILSKRQINDLIDAIEEKLNET